MESKGYSLWLMPQGKDYDMYATLIKNLAGQYNAPIFQPHITLLGDFPQAEDESIKLTQALVMGQKSFPITMGPVDYQDFHFRALFVRAIVTEPLLNLHNRAKQIFGMQDIPAYMPHLSILYGNYPQEIKEEIISQIGKEQPSEFEINKVSLIKGGLVHEWKVIKEFNLK